MIQEAGRRVSKVYFSLNPYNPQRALKGSQTTPTYSPKNAILKDERVPQKSDGHIRTAQAQPTRILNNFQVEAKIKKHSTNAAQLTEKAISMTILQK